MLDTFKIADKIESDTKKSGRYTLLKEEIVYIQVITTLQRIAEVLSWDIPESSKEK